MLTVVAPDDEKAVWINQDAWFSLANLSNGFETSYNWHSQNSGVYAFLIKGNATINGQELEERDGLGIWDTADPLQIKAGSDAELLAHRSTHGIGSHIIKQYFSMHKTKYHDNLQN